VACIYEFGDWRLDTRDGSLRCRGSTVQLRPTLFRILLVLLRNCGRIAEKQELIEAVWPATHISGGNLKQNIYLLRNVLASSKDRIEAVPRRGYRFTGTVKEIPSLGSQADQICRRARVHFRDRYSPRGLMQALRLFQIAIAEDPKCAAAYAGLADCYTIGVFWGSSIPWQDAIAKAAQAARRAVELDDLLPEAHVALALVRFRYEWDWPGAEKEFAKALALDPSSAYAHLEYAVFLAAMRRTNDALAQRQLARELDPFTPFIALISGWAFYIARAYERALEEYQYALSLDPCFPKAHTFASWVHEGQRDYASAVREALCDLDSKRASALRRAYQDGGVRKFWRTQLHLTDEPILRARLYARVGERKRAMKWLWRAFNEKSPRIPFLNSHPWWDPLRACPEFKDMLRRLEFER
jgi:DNA-binding winged helix-turn-helix (wHTH) protein